MRHDLPPLLSRILCGSLLFVDDLFSVFFLVLLCISFSRCSSLDICFFTYAFSSSLSRSFILTSFWRPLQLSCAFFAIRFTPFTSCLLWSYCPPSLPLVVPSLHELELQQFPPVDKALALPILLLCELIRNSKILGITVQLQPHQFDFPLKTLVANHLLTGLHIYQPTCNPRIMPNRVPAVRCTKVRHSSMRTSWSSSDVYWRTLMGYPNYERNRACALPSSQPFQYVMAKIGQQCSWPCMLKVAPCTVGRTVSSPIYFGLMGYSYFVQVLHTCCAQTSAGQE